MALTKKQISECKKRLLEEKEKIQNLILSNQMVLKDRPKGSGDDADKTQAQLEEKQATGMIDRSRRKLLEIEQALVRIEKGTYGICEETEEPIEIGRLMAHPSTCLSIEGAENREKERKRRA